MKSLPELQIETYELLKIRKPEFTEWYEKQIQKLVDEIWEHVVLIIDNQPDLFDN